MIRAARSTVFSILVLSCLSAPALAGGFDVSELPRVSGAELTYAGPTSTIYVAPGSVEEAADAVAATLAAEGWQAYSDPFSRSAANAQMRIMTFKKGPQAINAFVTIAPAQNDATSVTYTAVALANDLPFPKGGAEIGFAPERPHLRALSEEDVAPLLDFYRTEMGALGYRPWAEKPDQISDTSAVAFFTRDDDQILVLSLARNDTGSTRIDISPTRAALLTAEIEPEAQSEASEQTKAQAKAEASERHQDLSAEINALVEAELGKALGDLQQSLGAARPPAAQAEDEGAADEPQAAVAEQFSGDDLTVEDVAGYPVPKRRTSSGSESTQYRVTVNATVPMDVETMLDFYRRELVKLGWSEGQGAQVSTGHANVKFTAPDGPASLTLERNGTETFVTLALRKPDVAKEAGVLPKPGQAKVLIGNSGESEADVTIDKQTFRVKPGDGAKNPDGPALDLAPGTYEVTLTMDGSTESETIEVGADEAWGLLIGLGGLLPLQVY
jgi:hypothetical protein